MFTRTLIVLLSLSVCFTAGAQLFDSAVAQEHLKIINPSRFDLVAVFEVKQVTSVQRRMIPPELLSKLADKPEIRITRYLRRWIKTEDGEFLHSIIATSDGSSFQINGNSATLSKGDISRQLTFRIGQRREAFLNESEFTPTIDRIEERQPFKVPRDFLPMLEVAAFKNILLKKDVSWKAVDNTLVADISKADRKQTLIVSPLDFLPLEFVQEFREGKVVVRKFKYEKVALGGKIILFPMLFTLTQTFEGDTFMEVTSRVISISDPPELYLEKDGVMKDWVIPQSVKRFLTEGV